MIINSPKKSQIPDLRSLWAEAFGDSEDFLDRFFSVAFAPERCRILIDNNKLASALYWFDCELDGRKIAYLYAIATAKSAQGKGYCSALMSDTHSHLIQCGYSAAMLCPASGTLFEFYRRLGYQNATNISEFTYTSSNETLQMIQISISEYLLLRREYLPSGGVIQEKECAEFLQTFSKFYKADDFIICAREENGSFFATEILGNTKNAPKILATLGYKQGVFRGVGNQKPFSMINNFSEMPSVSYLGIALD